MKRAHRRTARREHRRIGRRTGAAAAAAVGTAVALASPAQAATFEVNSRFDNGDGTCDATCTIRDAILGANTNGAGADTINFRTGLTGTIVLTSGELDIESSMTIQGPGPDEIAISGDANQNNAPDAGDSRVFLVDPDSVGAPNDPVTISGLAMTEGFTVNYGGALYALKAALTLDDVLITDNQGLYGGGIGASDSALTITDSVLRDNFAPLYGGGIYARDPSPGVPIGLTIRDSTLSGNGAGGSGGAMQFDDAMDSLLIAGSTVSDNRAGTAGGLSIEGTSVSPAVIRNSTISGNVAQDGAGGMSLTDGGDLGTRIENSTIVGNVAGADGTGRGGGIVLNSGALGTTTISSTIVADNVEQLGAPNDFSDGLPLPPQVRVGFSLVENPGSIPLTQDPAGSNLLGVDPQLNGLADNGGLTRTHLPSPSSPVIDAGIGNGLTLDQRLALRTQQQPGADAAGGDGTDIGAVERPDVALEAPVISAKRKQKAKGRKIKVVVTAGAGEDVSALASGSINAGKSFPLKDAKAEVAGGTTEKLTLKPKKKSGSKQIAKALADGKKAKAAVTVLLTDAAGNRDSQKVGVTLKGAGGKKGKK